MKNFLNLKQFLHLFVLFVTWKMKPLYSSNQTSFFGLDLQELLNLQIILPSNRLHSAFFGFLDNKEKF